jgi:hypothetical protein
MSSMKKRVYKMLQCPHLGCEKSYRQNNQLQWHEDWVHRGCRTNFVCDHVNDIGIKCDYACERPMDLVVHKKKHLDIRPFTCNHEDVDGKVCDYATRHRGNLVVHKYSHLGLRPFKCSHCPRDFTNTHCRRRHFLRHHTDYDDPDYILLRKKCTTACNKQYATDPEFRLKVLVRTSMQRVRRSMGLTKNTRSVAILGCIYEELMVHLHKNDRGLTLGPGVSIDHIRPIASFKLLGCRVELLKAANFNNLQLLSVQDNSKKKDSFTSADAAAYAISAGGLAIAELEKGWRLAGVCQCVVCVK